MEIAAALAAGIGGALAAILAYTATQKQRKQGGAATLWGRITYAGSIFLFAVIMVGTVLNVFLILGKQAEATEMRTKLDTITAQTNQRTIRMSLTLIDEHGLRSSGYGQFLKKVFAKGNFRTDPITVPGYIEGRDYEVVVPGPKLIPTDISIPQASLLWPGHGKVPDLPETLLLLRIWLPDAKGHADSARSVDIFLGGTAIINAVDFDQNQGSVTLELGVDFEGEDLNADVIDANRLNGAAAELVGTSPSRGREVDALAGCRANSITFMVSGVALQASDMQAIDATYKTLKFGLRKSVRVQT